MKDQIDILIAKYLSGNADGKETEAFQRWLNESPENLSYFKEAEKSWNAAAKGKITAGADLDFAWQDLTRRIEVKGAVVRPLFTVTRVAAAILLLAVMSILVAYLFSGTGEPVEFSKQLSANTDTFMTSQPPEASNLAASQPVPDTLEKPSDRRQKKNLAVMIAVNSEDSAMAFELPDGSKVYLNRNSKLTYPENFMKSRTVYLSGEAFFDVAHNKGEFMVYCQDMRVRVLGTSFNVKGYEPVNKVEVGVEEGLVEVKVRDNRKLDPVLLKQGEQSSYVPGQVAITKRKLSKKDKWWKNTGFRSKVKILFNKIMHSR
jgi:transmembrane sensor